MYIMGNIPIRQDHSVTKWLESKGSQPNQTEWDTYFNWYAEASKRL